LSLGDPYVGREKPGLDTTVVLDSSNEEDATDREQVLQEAASECFPLTCDEQLEERITTSVVIQNHNCIPPKEIGYASLSHEGAGGEMNTTYTTSSPCPALDDAHNHNLPLWTTGPDSRCSDVVDFHIPQTFSPEELNSSPVWPTRTAEYVQSQTDQQALGGMHMPSFYPFPPRYNASGFKEPHAQLDSISRTYHDPRSQGFSQNPFMVLPSCHNAFIICIPFATMPPVCCYPTSPYSNEFNHWNHSQLGFPNGAGTY
jgi:hypothetical protein